MNKLNRKVALAALAASAIALGSTMANAATVIYHGPVKHPAATETRIAADVARVRVARPVVAWSPQECVPGGYWYMYRPSGSAVPIACDGTWSHRFF